MLKVFFCLVVAVAATFCVTVLPMVTLRIDTSKPLPGRTAVMVIPAEPLAWVETILAKTGSAEIAARSPACTFAVVATVAVKLTERPLIVALYTSPTLTLFAIVKVSTCAPAVVTVARACPLNTDSLLV